YSLTESRRGGFPMPWSRRGRWLLDEGRVQDAAGRCSSGALRLLPGNHTVHQEDASDQRHQQRDPQANVWPGGDIAANPIQIPLDPTHDEKKEEYKKQRKHGGDQRKNVFGSAARGLKPQESTWSAGGAVYSARCLRRRSTFSVIPICLMR